MEIGFASSSERAPRENGLSPERARLLFSIGIDGRRFRVLTCGLAHLHSDQPRNEHREAELYRDAFRHRRVASLPSYWRDGATPDWREGRKAVVAKNGCN